MFFFSVLVNMPWPDWNDRPLRSAMQYNLGIALHEQGDYDEAVEAFDRAISIKAFYPECHLWRGLSLMKNDKLELAEESFQRSLQQEPDSAMAHYELRRALVLRAKRTRDREQKKALAEKALYHWKKARDLAPGIYPEPPSVDMD